MEISFCKALGEAFILASVQASLGSVELSSRYSIINFTKDQETLDNASVSLFTYTIIGTIWTIGTILVLYSQFGKMGIYLGLLTNLVMMGWTTVVIIIRKLR